MLLSPEYLPAMRKRKSSDAFGDTANNLGTAMDELMRHQPSLRVAAIKAIIGVSMTCTADSLNSSRKHLFMILVLFDNLLWW